MALVSGKAKFKPSKNDYDWLGEGMYFWEGNPERAMEYAAENIRRRKSRAIPAVVGAVLNLGHCLNFTEKFHLDNLNQAYDVLEEVLTYLDKPMPQNHCGSDKLKRRLDCAVIQMLHTMHEKSGKTRFDSCKSVFMEGDSVYPDASFKTKTHVQIAIRNPNCIKGYFWPRETDGHYRDL